MSECEQTNFSRRTVAKRKITNICKRFAHIKHVNGANQTVHDLRQNMTVALSRFQELDEKCISFLEAAETDQREMTLTTRSISEDIAASEEYVTAADEFMFETGRYIEMNPIIPPTTNAIHVSAPGINHRISFRPMTHDDCYLWFMQLDDVFSSQGITSQITKFAALTTLLTEDEAYVVRDLTLMGDDRPMDVFDAAKKLFIHQYQLTVHQRLSQAFAMGGIQADEKPSQWMARFRHTGGEWEREDVERWALFRQHPNALRTALEVPTPQLTMDELLNKADDLFATLPRDTVASVDTHITAAVFTKTPTKRRAMNNESDKHNAGKSKQLDTLCWYHRKFGDKARFCSGPPCPRYNPSLPKGRTTESGNAKGNP